METIVGTAMTETEANGAVEMLAVEEIKADTDMAMIVDTHSDRGRVPRDLEQPPIHMSMPKSKSGKMSVSVKHLESARRNT
jgi:hypothetical protein